MKVSMFTRSATMWIAVALATASGAVSAMNQKPSPVLPMLSYVQNMDSNQVRLLSQLSAIGQEDRPAPLSIRDDIPLVYNTPSPSQVKPELIGPVQFIRSARVDEDAATVILPLYEGHLANGESAWYVITDTSSRDLADHLGLAFSAKLGYVDQGKAVRTAKLAKDGTFVFASGRVDFMPARMVMPGPAGKVFPPAMARPGSVGDADYTPIVKVDGVYYNAPVVASNITAAQLQMFANGNVDYRYVHDKVVKIDPAAKTVTVKMTAGYSFAKPIFYLSTDANDATVAALEESTLAPALNDANQDLADAHPGQGNERIAIFINGPTGKDNPFRQGIESALTDGRFPLNVFGGVPTINLDYSPIWDGEMVQWTEKAIKAGYRTRIIDLFQMFGLEKQGVLEGAGGGPIKRSGIVINCPVISRLI